MQYVGIDLHKKRSRCVVVDQDGQVVRKRTIPSTLACPPRTSPG